jgi:hypothetical protein
MRVIYQRPARLAKSPPKAAIMIWSCCFLDSAAEICWCRYHRPRFASYGFVSFELGTVLLSFVSGSSCSCLDIQLPTQLCFQVFVQSRLFALRQSIQLFLTRYHTSRSQSALREGHRGTKTTSFVPFWRLWLTAKQMLPKQRAINDYCLASTTMPINSFIAQRKITHRCSAIPIMPLYSLIVSRSLSPC